MKSCQKLFQQFSELAEPMTFGSSQVIIYRGLKITRKFENGDFRITIEDTSFDDYSPLKNKMLIESLIDYAIRQKEIIRAKENCADVGG